MKNKITKIMLIMVMLFSIGLLVTSCGEQTTDDVQLTIALTSSVTVGEKPQATVSFTPTDAAQDVSWRSSDESVASIDGNGLITTKKAGETVITVSLVSDENVKTSKTLTVKPASATLNGNYIDNDDHWVFFSGVKYTFSNNNVKLKDENNDVLELAIVDDKVVIYAMHPGEAYITSLDGVNEMLIKVTYDIVSFGKGTDADAFLDKVNQEEYRGDKDYPMYVGFQNVFKYDVSVTAKQFNSNRQVVNVNPEVGELDVEYQLVVDQAVVSFDELAEFVDGGIKFKPAALGKVIEVSIKSKYDDEFNDYCLITINDGYNVYDNKGLKELFADLTVEKINILRNVKAELLESQYYIKNGVKVPYNTFSALEETQGKQGSVYLRYNASSTGHFIIEGNYFTINGEDIPLLVGSDEEGQGGYVDAAKTVIAANTAIFRISKDAKTSSERDDSSFTINNLKIVGNSNRPDVDDIAISGGYMNCRLDNVDGYINNTILRYGVLGVNVAGDFTNLDATDSIVSDFWANSIITWSSGTINVKNSLVSNAGGSAICLVDAAEDTSLNPVLIIDNETEIKNYTHAGSAWFVGYGLGGVSALIAGVENTLIAMKSFNPNFNKTLLVEEATTSGQQVFNFAVMIQNMDPLNPSSNPYPQATVTIGGITVTRPYNYVSAHPIMAPIAQNGAIFVPFGSDFGTPLQTAFAQFMGQGMNQADALNAAFVSTFMTLMSTASVPYIEMMPGAFKVSVITHLYDKS